MKPRLTREMAKLKELIINHNINQLRDQESEFIDCIEAFKVSKSGYIMNAFTFAIANNNF